MEEPKKLMGKKLLSSVGIFCVALGILFASILQSSSVKYVFSQEPSQIEADIPDIDYQLPGTGAVGPDDPFWTLEVIRDKFWLGITFDEIKKTELYMLFADKRISYAEQLAIHGKFTESIAVSEKAELYLQHAYENARQTETKDEDYKQLTTKLIMSGYKHRAVLEEIYSIAPEDARPTIAGQINTPKTISEYSSHMLNEMNVSAPNNPFGTN